MFQWLLISRNRTSQVLELQMDDSAFIRLSGLSPFVSTTQVPECSQICEQSYTSGTSIPLRRWRANLEALFFVIPENHCFFFLPLLAPDFLNVPSAVCL